MNDYAAFTDQELLAAYAEHRRRVALASTKYLRRDLDMLEAELASRITGKNAEERKINLTLACSRDSDHALILIRIEALERQQAEAEAECEIICKCLAARQWSIRLRIVEALERLGHDRDAELSTPLVDSMIDDELPF